MTFHVVLAFNIVCLMLASSYHSVHQSPSKNNFWKKTICQLENKFILDLLSRNINIGFCLQNCDSSNSDCPTKPHNIPIRHRAHFISTNGPTQNFRLPIQNTTVLHISSHSNLISTVKVDANGITSQDKTWTCFSKPWRLSNHLLQRMLANRGLKVHYNKEEMGNVSEPCTQKKDEIQFCIGLSSEREYSDLHRTWIVKEHSSLSEVYPSPKRHVCKDKLNSYPTYQQKPLL